MVAAGCLWVVCQEILPLIDGRQIDLQTVIAATKTSKATIKDVKRLMGGLEFCKMTKIFALEIADLNRVFNQITLKKITEVAERLCRLSLAKPGKTWVLAAFAVYFVLTINDAPFDEIDFLQTSRVEANQVLQLTKKVLPYRDAIIADCLDRVYRGPSAGYSDAGWSF